MVKHSLRSFVHLWSRLVEALIRTVDRVEDSSVTRGREKQKKTVDLNINDLSLDVFHGKMFSVDWVKR